MTKLTPSPSGKVPATWRRRPIISYLVARSGSTIAFQMMGVAVGYQLYTLTGSAFALGLIGLTQFGTMLTFTLLAGYLADLLDRRRLIAICQAIQCGVAVALALAVVFGWLTVPGIFALVAVGGCARACEQPTEQALLPGLVSREELARLVAFATSVNQACIVIGPALAGLCYSIDAAMPYAAVAVILLCAMTAVLGIPALPRPSGKATLSLDFILSGLAFIRSHRIVLGAISLDLFTVMFGGMMVLLPVFAVDVLHTDVVGLGMLRSAPALGSVVAALVLTRISFGDIGPAMLKSSVAFGLLTVAFAFSNSLALSLVLLVALGASNVVGVVVRHTLVQTETPDALRGRVSAASSLFMGTANQLGDFKAGLLAGLVGPVAAVALGGLGAAAVGLLWMRLFPEIRSLKRL